MSFAVPIFLPPFRRISGYLFLGGSFLAAFFLLTAPPETFWGTLHEPHTSNRTIDVKEGTTVTQTFQWEQRHLHRLVLWIDPKKPRPKHGNIHILVQGKTTAEAVVSVQDIPPSGIVVATFPKDIASPKTAGAFTLSTTSTELFHFRYQIDGTKYPNGSLARNGAIVAGDLAFQGEYHIPVFGNRLFQWGTVLLLCICGSLLFFLSRNHSLSQKCFARPDILFAGCIGILGTASYAYWLLMPGVWVGPSDFTKDASYLAAAAASVHAFALPLWSHLTCGGILLLGNSESNVLSLGTLFALFLPPDRALLFLLALEAGIGGAGTYLLARTLGCSRRGALLAALIVTLSPTYAYRIVEGFTMLGGVVASLPWVFLGFLRSNKTHSFSWMLCGGIALGYMFLRGDVHVLGAVLFFLLLWVVGECIYRRSLLPVFPLLGILSCFFLLSSLKLYTFLEHPEQLAGHLKPYTALLFKQHIFDDVFFSLPPRTLSIPVLHGRRGEEWGNFGGYIGIFPLLLLLPTLFVRFPYKKRILLTLSLSLLLAEGTLYALLFQYIPLLSALFRIPTRVLAITLLSIALLVGKGTDTLLQRFSLSFRPLLFFAFFLAVGIDLLTAQAAVLRDDFLFRTEIHLAPPSVPTWRTSANPSPHDERHATVLLRSGYGIPFLCADPNIPPAFLHEKDVSTPYADVPLRLGPNTITIAPPAAPSDTHIRERYVSSWETRDGVLLPDKNGGIEFVHTSSSPTVTFTYKSALSNMLWVLLVLFGSIVALGGVYALLPKRLFRQR